MLAPADGKVVVIEETNETEYLNSRRKQISIFMSPVNVHVNRTPVAGIVSYFKYHPGKYLVAWHPKSSTENERSTVVVKMKNGVEILFRQVAGALARRIMLRAMDNVITRRGVRLIKSDRVSHLYTLMHGRSNRRHHQVAHNNRGLYTHLQKAQPTFALPLSGHISLYGSRITSTGYNSNKSAPRGDIIGNVGIGVTPATTPSFLWMKPTPTSI